MIDMKWKIEFEMHLKEYREFQDIWVKVYALIWENYCSREVQMDFKEMPDFDSTINNQPLVLLEQVEYLMYMTTRGNHPPLKK